MSLLAVIESTAGGNLHIHLASGYHFFGGTDNRFVTTASLIREV